MKKFAVWFFCITILACVFAAPAYAPLVTVQSENKPSDDDSTVDGSDLADLRDVDTDQPVQSPSLENETDEKK